ncbi:MAG: tetratricopeptide repeat protein, partial [Fimbriimonadaceae bacterium]
AQVDQEGEQRAAYVNVADKLVEFSFIAPLFEQSDVDKAMDGLIEVTDENFKVTQRFFERGNETPVFEKEYQIGVDGLFASMTEMTAELARQANVAVLDKLEFGTDDARAFLNFIEGFDSLQYVQQANGMVAQEFSPDHSYASLLKSLEADKEFVGPYETICGLSRLCAQHRIGTFDAAEAALRKASEIVPDDFKAFYALGELYQGVSLADRATSAYEKALTLHEQERDNATKDGRVEDWLLEKASIYSRLGVAQMTMGMPVNAELNFKKAIDLEGPDKPSLQFLAGVLAQTGRAHEIPGLWKAQLEKNPDSVQLTVAYAVALVNAERMEDGVKQFEEALEKFSEEERLFVKRFYAPLLVNNEDLDRAMDFYEDCMDTAPNDIPLLLEYARTLATAKREFEVPAVLDSILASNPDPNTRAETLAWKTELTEPKRAEAVVSAEKKLSEGDFEGAVRELRPLRNWLADYWKLWAILASAHNRLNQPEEAKDAAERLINLYPGCELAYAELMAALTTMGKTDDAYSLMRYAAGMMPSSLGIHLNLALAAKRAGHTDEAKAIAKQIREAVGPNAELDPVFAEIEA